MSNQLKYVSLTNLLGNTLATKTTVALFNSIRPQLKDNRGKYVEIAVKPHLTGVLVEKQYL